MSVDISNISYDNKFMTAQAIYKEIETLSQVQLETVYSFVRRIKLPQPSTETGRIEPFSNEQEALNFINDYSQRIINAQG